MERVVLRCTEAGIRVVPARGDIWMTKHEIAELLGCFVAKVAINIAAILKTGVIDESRVRLLCRQANGNYVELYNLEMIIALAFRIKSSNADILRGWLMRHVSQGEKTKMAAHPLVIMISDTGTPN